MSCMRIFGCCACASVNALHAEAVTETASERIWNLCKVGASAVILAANYTLDSLMLKYQGVDWADPANWNCNAGCAHALGL